MTKTLPILVIALIAAACSGSSSETTATTESPPTTSVTATTATTTPTTSTTEPPSTTSRPSTTVAPRTSSTTTTSPPPTRPSTTTSQPSSVRAGTGSGSKPSVEITGPGNLTRFAATYDPGRGLFGANVALAASVFDPDDDIVSVEWFSSQEGFLGSGATVSARINTLGSDSSQPVITVRVRDAAGNVTESSIQLIVYIESDQ